MLRIVDVFATDITRELLANKLSYLHNLALQQAVLKGEQTTANGVDDAEGAQPPAPEHPRRLPGVYFPLFQQGNAPPDTHPQLPAPQHPPYGPSPMPSLTPGLPGADGRAVQPGRQWRTGGRAVPGPPP